MKSAPAGYIRFTFMDTANDEFVALGGAAWMTAAEVESEWQQLPSVPRGGNFLADRLQPDVHDLIDTKPVSVETIEAKLGERIAVLIERGRHENRREQERLVTRRRGRAA